jgi:dihydroxyacetone kinase-like protein
MGIAFAEADGKVVVDRMIDMIHENRAYLSEVDGAIGDGDHGINMNKGFMLVKKQLDGNESIGMSEALKILGRTLVEEIGGSMGPLYGMFFRRMARASKHDEINTHVLKDMLSSAFQGVQELGDAHVGDKTLMDTLDPAVKAVEKADAEGKPLDQAIDDMIAAAETGWKSTKDMVAKVGRASRLGERSRGALDAGATSCYLLLKTMGETMKELSA